MLKNPARHVTLLSHIIDAVSKLIDLTSQHFERWTVIRRGAANPIHTMWVCRCQCGNERLVQAGNLINGLSKSCGCLKNEMTILRSTIHGHSRPGKVTREYLAWQLMKRRCYVPRSKDWPLYGGRGIVVHKPWKDDFLCFLDYLPTDLL